MTSWALSRRTSRDSSQARRLSRSRTNRDDGAPVAPPTHGPASCGAFLHPCGHSCDNLPHIHYGYFRIQLSPSKLRCTRFPRALAGWGCSIGSPNLQNMAEEACSLREHRHRRPFGNPRQAGTGWNRGGGMSAVSTKSPTGARRLPPPWGSQADNRR